MCDMRSRSALPSLVRTKEDLGEGDRLGCARERAKIGSGKEAGRNDKEEQTQQ